jgi:hypothetical protein
MDVNMLSNYMFGILVILLIIVIVVMYYLWNETKKNKNEITILQSDMSALRERLDQSSKKIDELESFESSHSQYPRKNVSKMSEQNILEHLMNNMQGFDVSDFMRSGNEEDYEDEEESDEDSGEEEEEMSGEEEEEMSGEEEEMSGEEEEMSGEEEEMSGEEEEEMSGEEEDESDEESGEEEEEMSGEEEEEEEMSGEEEEVVEEEVCDACEEPKVEEVKEIIFSSEEVQMDLGKKPIQGASSFEEGHIEPGMDKRKYIVAVNKKGSKYWKLYK